jgi:hypothetical protein
MISKFGRKQNLFLHCKHLYFIFMMVSNVDPEINLFIHASKFSFNEVKLIFKRGSLDIIYFLGFLSAKHYCRKPFYKGCPKHHRHKEDPGVTPGTCGADGKNAQVILICVSAPAVATASHPQD